MKKEQFSSSEIKNDFERQFSKKEIFDVLDGKIEAIDIRPENQKTETPVLFAPGWSCTTETYKDSIKELVKKERRVFGINHARRGIDTGLISPEVREKHSDDELRKALSILALIKEKNIEQVDMIAHSEGAINAAIAASIEPEKFRNIVFVAPAGIIGKDKFPKLAGRFAITMIKDYFRSVFGSNTEKICFSRTIKESIKYIAKNPLRALKESVAISESEIHNMLKDLHEKGIGVAVVAGVDDKVFPMDKIQQIAKNDELDGFLSVKGGHNEIIFDPEKYVTAAEQLLTQLEKKQEKSIVK
jgi:pimeloyl-ACP methyl ester carboxylesterase